MSGDGALSPTQQQPALGLLRCGKFSARDRHASFCGIMSGQAGSAMRCVRAAAPAMSSYEHGQKLFRDYPSNCREPSFLRERRRKSRSVEALAALAGRSRRWIELRIRAAGVRSVSGIVVGMRIATAHHDLMNPSIRSSAIAKYHGFGSVRTLRSQIQATVGVSADVVRSGMEPAELARRIAHRLRI